MGILTVSDTREKITSKEIREKFLSYFESKDHLRIKNSSIIPKNDPTLLFINAGMAPMKKFFTGEESPEKPRLCNVQTCIRTIDLDDVGDKSHLTSFSMLGSWSIGDYFKEGAIKLAYEFLTKHLNIPNEKLYVTVFAGDKSIGLDVDDECKKWWKEVGILEDHIVECPMEDNFWIAGETGPCGPCTEVFYDTRDDDVNKYVPGGYFDTKTRYIEIWNAGVCMQFNRNLDGTYSPLKFKSIDTGAGLERLTMTLNKMSSVYDTDLLKPICDKINELANGKLSERTVRVLTDHTRTISLILSEKQAPSNEGRGYVPRKLVRRCILLTTKESVKDFDYLSLYNFFIDNYSDIFPLIKENKDFLLSHFEKEYEQFNKVLVSGLEKLDEIKTKGNNISKEDAFDLVTTYGLPFDIIEDYAKDNNLIVDSAGFEEKIKEHKDLSTKQAKGDAESCNISFVELENFEKTDFRGYEEESVEGKILGIFDGGKKISSTKDRASSNFIIVTDKTSFYAESGGQCADTGVILKGEAKFKVQDVQKTKNGVFYHFVTRECGDFGEGDTVTLNIDSKKRLQTANNHSTTHLLHRALRDILGKDVHQAGSKVDSERLRFDFNYDGKISEENLFQIEREVNSFIRENASLDITYKTLEEAQKDGAMALFETKYGDKVRVVTFGDISKELCAGTHTSKTGNIGLFVILNVDGIGKGIRRINAITGDAAISYMQEKAKLVSSVCDNLKVKEDLVLQKLNSLEERLKNSSTKQSTNIDANDLEKFTSNSNLDISFLSQKEFDKTLRDKLVMLSDNLNRVVIYVGGENEKQILISTPKAKEKDFPANKILKDLFSKCEGKGGGNPRLATGGGIKVKDSEIKNFIKEL